MKFKNVLLLYKRSAYKIYFLDKESSLSLKVNSVIKKEKAHFNAAHQSHYEALKFVSRFLLENGVRYDERFRGKKINYDKYDLIITVGGDGTFLEAARHLKKQLIIGVNSAPQHSVGNFCVATAEMFPKIFNRIMNGSYQLKQLHRIEINFSNLDMEVNALNDILVCHRNPAMLCRYFIKVGSSVEQQRSSGVWVSTPSGSTGAIRSAGGRKLKTDAKEFQYKPRELYQGLNEKYALTGGVLHNRQELVLTSLMRQGRVYVDGAHKVYPFEYGDLIKIRISKNYINTIQR